jgi:hypothetical protein
VLSQIGSKQDARTRLQQQTTRCRQPALLTPSDPPQRSALECPRRSAPAPVECERNREAEKGETECYEAGDHERQVGFAHALQRGCEYEVENTHGGGTPGQGIGHAVHQCGLQAEADHGDAKHQGAVDRVAQRGGLLPRVAHRGCHVHQEEQGEERLGGVEVPGVVEARPPGQTNGKGEDEPGKVEPAPRLAPGQQKHAGIEQGVIGKQLDVAATAGRGQDGRGKPAGAADDGEDRGILADGQKRCDANQAEHHGEGCAGRHDPVQAQGGKRSEIEHGDAAALQAQRVAAAHMAQAPADGPERDTDAGDTCEAEFGRQHRVLHCIADEKGEAEEQHQDAGANQGVAAEKPVTTAGIKGVEVDAVCWRRSNGCGLRLGRELRLGDGCRKSACAGFVHCRDNAARRRDFECCIGLRMCRCACHRLARGESLGHVVLAQSGA